VFIPTIAPTALVYKVNLVGLAAMYRTAHTPELQDIIDQMVFLVCQYDPRISFMFCDRRLENYAPEIDTELANGQVIWTEPLVKLKKFDRWPEECPVPTQANLHPIDLLHADPRFMPLATCNVNSEVTLSLMTMGQDQRHRTIARGTPVFTGAFYLPPVPEMLNLGDTAELFMNRWLSLASGIPGEVAALIAPYGAMVRYTKSGDYRQSYTTEQASMLLRASRDFRTSRASFVNSFLLVTLRTQSSASCLLGVSVATGSVCEGRRYCGRDISIQESLESEYFASRRI
jgi:hypothetical protein